jgi:rod shape determining protein RodA
MALAQATGWPSTVIEKLKRIQWPVLLAACVLAAVGTVTLYSISGGALSPWVERHSLRFALALAAVVAMALVRLEVWIKLAYPAYAIALLFLILVPFIGIEARGAIRWIGAGSLSFQPSELMKLALVGALARYYFRLPAEEVGSLRGVLLPLAMIAVPVVLTLLQPDLGSALLFAVLGLSLMFLAGVPLAYFVVAGITALAFLPMIWSGLYTYQRRRIEVFLNPEIDPFGAGYHITQSKVALSFGGIFGKGFMNGMESPFGFVPEKHTDFIASIIGEQWGFVGLLLLLAIYAVLIMMMMGMASRCQNRFARLVIAGSAMTFFIYVFINLAMVTGLVPVVGVPLPLISYGGTSMVTLMAGLGLAMSAYVHCQEAESSAIRRAW